MNRFDSIEKKALCALVDRTDKTLSNYSYSYYAEGGEVWKFEKEFAKWLGRKYCVAVNSGTSALFVAIKALSVKTGGILGKNNCLELKDQWIAIPAYTFVADAEAVIASGNKPFFVDLMDDNTYCMTYPCSQTKWCNIQIPVHTLGNISEVAVNSKIGVDRFTIEDCAQCVGGKWKGKRAGTFGDIAIFSFQGTKTISTGEGGMLAMDDERLYQLCAGIRNHCDMYKHKYKLDKYPELENVLGYNLRMTELQACVGRCQLRKLPMFLKEFKANARLIFELLPIGITPPYIPKEVDHAYFLLCCLWQGKPELRNKFLEKLNYERRKKKMFFVAKGSPIGGVNAPAGNIVSQGYSTPLYDYPLYRKYKRSCPNTEELIRRSIWIDLHRFTTKAKIIKEMDLFNRVYNQVIG